MTDLTRIQQIIKLARSTLSDVNSQSYRWSDARLIALVNEAQMDIAKHAMILKGDTYIVPVLNQEMYTLPDDAWMLSRASYNGEKIALLTYDNLDSMAEARATSTGENENTIDFSVAGIAWETEKGSEVVAVVYDRRDMGEVRLYPIPNNVDTAWNNDSYGVVASIDDTDFTFTSVYGVLVGIIDTDENYSVVDLYGVTSEVIDSTGVVKLWYVRTPEMIELDIDTLEIPPMYDVAIKHYVVSQAYGDDNDTGFERKSAAAASLYQRELTMMTTATAKNHRKGGARKVQYRGAFNQ